MKARILLEARDGCGKCGPIIPGKGKALTLGFRGKRSGNCVGTSEEAPDRRKINSLESKNNVGNPSHRSVGEAVSGNEYLSYSGSKRKKTRRQKKAENRGGSTRCKIFLELL